MGTEIEAHKPQLLPAVASDVIAAAGGLLWREENGARLLALIHRPRYSDWSLPKGKLEPGEGWQVGAMREVHEETGCQVTLGAFAGAISYSTPAPKVVLFWHMETTDPGGRSDEADQVRWLTPQAAMALVDYDDVRALIARAANVAGAPIARPVLSLPRAAPSHRRLQAAVASLGPEVERAVADARSRRESGPWIDAARDHLASARASAAASEGQTATGWGALEASARALIFGYGDAQLSAAVLSLRAEANEKIKNWRGQAITTLLDKREWDALSIPDRRVRLHEATALRDQHGQNAYFRLEVLGRQVRYLVYFLGAALGAFLLLVGVRQALGVPIVLDGGATITVQDALATAAVGALGGSFSALLTITRAGARARIPDQLSLSVATAMRPLTGAVAAIGVVLLLRAGLVRADLVNGSVLLAFAFAAGFAERLVTGAIERVAGKDA